MNLKTKRGISALLMITAAGLAGTATLAAPAHAATTIKVSSGPILGGNELNATGTTASDSFQFDGSNGGIFVSSATTAVTAGTGCEQFGQFVFCSGITRIAAFGGSGDDTITNNTSVRMGVNGSSGNDKLIGGSGNDTLNGGFGNDFADGRNGHDTCSAESTANCESFT